MKQTVLLFLIAVGLMSCKELGLKNEYFTHQVKDVKEDDYFTTTYKKPPAFVRFTIKGDLSHDAKIIYAERDLAADTISSHQEILLKKGKIDMKVERDYYNEKIFVKYISLNDSTSGSLQIKIKI
jgi:hypothetical protein